MKEGVKEGGAYYVLILSTKCSFVLRKPLIEKIHYPRKRTDINAALTSFDVETLVGNQITRSGRRGQRLVREFFIFPLKP